MKKTNKFIFVATLIFTVMLAMTAFAADTWKQTEDGKWFCYDKDENMIYGEVKKSGNGFYYLDEATGEMVTNKLVEIDGNKYWFGADGAKVVDQWVQVPVENDGDGWEWMYFKPMTGKAETTNTKAVTINGKKYRFTSDGYMQYGYLAGNADTELTKADNAVVADWYFGEKTDGSAQTGWIKFTDGSAGPGYDEKELVYFYFKDGKKTVGEKKIDGVKYYFNEDGSLVTGYNVVTTGSIVATGSYYLGKADDGTMKKNQWVKTSAWSADKETEYWYYLGSDGRAFNANTEENVAKMKKINDKIYLFDNTGKMMTGFVVLSFNTKYQGLNNPTTEDYVVDADVVKTVADLKAIDVNDGARKIYYFSTDADNDGSMKTGAQTVILDGEEVTVYLDKRGCALEGVVKGYIYNNGILQKGVGVVTLNTKDDTYKNDKYLVNANGKILKKTTIKDEDGQLWAVREDYTYARFADQDYAGKAAKEWINGKTEFTVNNKTYYIHVNANYAKYDTTPGSPE